MSTSPYSGRLTDVGVQSLAGLSPRLTVRPEVEAFSSGGEVVSSHRVEVPLSGTNFTMTLIPSDQLTPAQGGGNGVKYVIEVSLFAPTQDGGAVQVWHSEWRFAARPGGGSITAMGDAPVFRFFAGPPWPASPTPGAYYDTISGDFGPYPNGG